MAYGICEWFLCRVVISQALSESDGKEILVGSLANHEEEVYAAWNLAVQGLPFEKIKVVL